jgi:hypothetical protein
MQNEMKRDRPHQAQKVENSKGWMGKTLTGRKMD